MTQPSPLVVTASLKATEATLQTAQAKARAWGIPFVDRNRSGLERVLIHHDAALVFSNMGIHLATADGRLHHHLGTAYIRLKSLERGDSDPLVRAGELTPGDHLIDTTFGLGRDSAVAARALGPAGQITAIESSAALFHLANEALIGADPDPLAAPITLVHADARSYLAACETNSVDVVLVDPMFTAPKTSDAGFAILRSVADNTPLDQRWISEARRVARRWVILKAGSAMPWFDDEELTRVHSHSNATWYRTSPTKP